MELDIGEVARRSGVAPSALRYYEARGLIRAIGRRGLRRVFAGEVLERLALIGLGQTAGFSLDELVDLLAQDGELDRGKLAAKADELDITLRRLTALRDGLRHAAICPASRHLECPQFRRLLNISQRRSVQASNKGRR